jgi:hypothetical protein
MSLAGTTVVPGNFFVRETLQGFRGPGIAIPQNMNHPALVALPFPPTDTLDLYPRGPDCLKDRGSPGNQRIFFHRVEEHTDQISHYSSFCYRCRGISSFKSVAHQPLQMISSADTMYIRFQAASVP